MFNEAHYGKLEMFNLMHIMTLSFLIIVIVLFYLFKEKIKNETFEKRFRIFMGIFLLSFETSFHIWIYSRGGYGLSMIPLTGFCALTNLLTILALLFNKTKMFNYLIYYALTGALLSLVFVDTKFGIPHFRYFHYFFVHFGFLIVSLYYYFTGKLDLSFKNFFMSSAVLLIYSLILLPIDLLLEENWFYLLENPLKGISDALGFPLYPILWILTITALMTFWYFLLNGFKIKKKK